MIPVILSGGSGTRLWPYSRSLHPKQFLPLLDDDSLFQQTLLRLKNRVSTQQPIVICNQDHRFMVAEQLRQIQQTGDIVLEPVGRNTAPAIALAALYASQQGQDPVLLVLPADHAISQHEAFHHALTQAQTLAEQGFLVTFGIVPQRPETGYGYIKARQEAAVYHVEQFVEKPDSATAQAYLQSGQYFWNSGMFAFKASVLLAQMQQLAPEILSACQQALELAKHDLDFVRVDEKSFGQCPSISIDYAIMEKSQQVAMVALDAGWSDVGSWHSLWEIGTKDDAGNVLKGDVLLTDSRDNYIQSDNKLVATLGVDNLVIVETDDAILVADKNRVQDVKTLVNQLENAGRSEARQHRKVYRPWGYYDSIDAGPRFQVKRIVVNPGQQLSLQMHHHRAEHWVVVSGTALVTRDDEQLLLSENQSTFIPLGVKHRLENPGTIALEMIEVQSGSYLGEDDIVRFEDTYGRP